MVARAGHAGCHDTGRDKPLPYDLVPCTSAARAQMPARPCLRPTRREADGTGVGATLVVARGERRRARTSLALRRWAGNEESPVQVLRRVAQAFAAWCSATAAPTTMNGIIGTW